MSLPTELTLALIGLAVGIVWGATRLINAIIERRISKMEYDAERERAREAERHAREEELRKERDAERNRKLEEIRQQAEQSQAIIETMNNLVTAFTVLDKGRIEDRNLVAEKFHQQGEKLTMQAEAIGEFADKMDKLALAALDNVTISRAVKDIVVEIRDKINILTYHPNSEKPAA